ncbi:MAG TPA: hypothetical protein VIY86_03555, partial [Pirellulaceae bacterium]
ELPDVAWFNPLGTAVDWAGNDKALTCFFTAPDVTEDPEGVARHVLLLFNADDVSRHFVLPALARAETWRLFVDTAMEPPHDIFPDADGPTPPPSGRIKLMERSLRCYVAHAPGDPDQGVLDDTREKDPKPDHGSNA